MKTTAIIFLLLLTAASASAVVPRSNRDPRVDQDLRTTASPTFVDLILTGANISSDNPIGFRPSGDNNDYLSLSTVGNIPTITTIGGGLFNITSDIPGTGSLIGFTGTSGTGMQIGWLEATGARIIAPLGVFNLITNNDIDDYFQFSTIGGIPTMQAIGGTVIDFPGMSFTGIGGIEMSGTLDFGTNTIADGQMNGDWNLNGGDLTAGTLIADAAGFGNAITTPDRAFHIRDSGGDFAKIESTGTSTSVLRLDVGGNINRSFLIAYGSGNALYGMLALKANLPTHGKIGFFTAAVERMRIENDGDIDFLSNDISGVGNLFVGGNLTVAFESLFSGSVSINTSDGINYGSGPDVDSDIFTIDVTGNPKAWFDFSEGEIVFTVPISAPAYRGASDIRMEEDGIFFGVDDEAKIYVGLTAEFVDAWILESLDPDHDLLLKTARSFKFEAADDMEISVQVFGICIDDNSHVEIENGLIEFFGNGPTGEDETLLTMSNDDTIPIFTFDARRSNINILGYPGDIGPGESHLSTHINIDETLATSSDATTEICGLDFGTTTSQAATKVAMCVSVGFDFALVIRGAVAEDPNQGYENTSGVVVDRVNSGGGGNDAFISNTTNVVIFDNQNDYILIGSNATFEDIQVALDIPSSGSIFSNPTVVNIYYSRAGGNWALLTILDDGTHGFQSSGNITFNAPGDWTKDDEDMDGNPITNALYILVQRTRAVLGTPPTELSFKTFASLKTGAAIRGDGTFKPVSLPDSLAENESIYYSSTQGNLVYKDSGGTVHDLY